MLCWKAKMCSTLLSYKVFDFTEDQDFKLKIGYNACQAG